MSTLLDIANEIDREVDDIPNKIKFDDNIYRVMYSNSYNKQKYVYSLALECGKYYVGYTMNLKYRLKEMFYSGSTIYTTIYKPIKVIRIFRGYKEESRKEKLRLVKLYGKENVKGYMSCVSK